MTDFGTKLGMDMNKLSDNAKPHIPLKRFGTSEEMAKTILFLATDATYMTGAQIVVDGGVTINSPLPKLE